MPEFRTYRILQGGRIGGPPAMDLTERALLAALILSVGGFVFVTLRFFF